MIIRPYCPARRARVEPAACYAAYLEANAGLARVLPAALRPCRKCAAGARNRARLAAEGDRIGTLEAEAWRGEIAEWAAERKRLTTQANGVYDDRAARRPRA